MDPPGTVIILGGIAVSGVWEGAAGVGPGVMDGWPMRGLPSPPDPGAPGGPRMFPFVIARLILGERGGLAPGPPFPG